jgi:hypothetical protein
VLKKTFNEIIEILTVGGSGRKKRKRIVDIAQIKYP